MKDRPTIDLTPSTIARRLLPEDATPEQIAIVEAMAECALRLVPQSTTAATMFAVERFMAQTGQAVWKQHLVRCERALKMIREFKDDEPGTEGSGTE